MPTCDVGQDLNPRKALETIDNVVPKRRKPLQRKGDGFRSDRCWKR